MKKHIYFIIAIFIPTVFNTTFALGTVFTSKAICIGFASHQWDCGDNEICQAIADGNFFNCKNDRDCMAITALKQRSKKEFCDHPDCKALLGFFGGYCSDTSISNCQHMISNKPQDCQELGENKKAEVDIEAIAKTMLPDVVHSITTNTQKLPTIETSQSYGMEKSTTKKPFCKDCHCNIL